jgi:NADPH-dependent 2,4-dienoyl-CoA reductase/sulfur reductase-like enzyme
MANKVVDEMEEEGVHLMMNTTIKTVEKLGDKLFEVELETKRGKTSYTEKV